MRNLSGQLLWAEGALQSKSGRPKAQNPPLKHITCCTEMVENHSAGSEIVRCMVCMSPEHQPSV